jgi:hypothetical protein
MLRVADRIAKTVSDLTVGTVIVLFHVALADRQARRRAPAPPALPWTRVDSTRVWHTQISP